MSDERVKPLFADASAPDALREFAALARADGPTQAELDRLASRLNASLMGAVVVAPAATTLDSAPSDLQRASQTPAVTRALFLRRLASSRAARILTALGISTGVGVAVWPAAPQLADMPARVGPALHAPPQRSIPAARAEPAPTPARKPAPAEPVTPEVSPGATPLATAVTQDTRTSRTKHAQVEHRRESAGRTHRRQRPRALAAQTPAATEPSPSELELIERAEAARSRPSEALSLLARHEQLYPRGALAQEREALAIELLARAGQVAVAKARASQFAAAYPESAHLPRVRALISRLERE